MIFDKLKHTIAIESCRDKNFIIKKATINFDNNKVFFVKIPISEKGALTKLSDPWVNILIFKMMETGGDFYISGTVSESLIHNAEYFSLIWHKWCPNQYKAIRIIPEKIKKRKFRKHNNRLITAFSGGLDAAYTAYKYRNRQQNGREYIYNSCLMIHGADIPLANEQQYKDAYCAAKNMTDDLKLKLISVSTNYRDYEGNWSYEFGAVISGILSFFSKRFAFGAATDSSVDNFSCPWGMNLISDRFLSSDEFEFISDGMEHNRIERIEMIKSWQACTDNLRVCWKNKDKSKNCGKCEKCIRTKLEYLCLGIGYLPTMPTQFSISDFDLIKDNPHMTFFEEAYLYAIKHNCLNKDVLDRLQVYINENK